MKRIIKSKDSLILSQNLKYKKGSDNSKITQLLLKEQKNFCAYTEHYIGCDDANDIEHFNPNLKNTPDDNYYNWYQVKHLPNQRKTNHWIEPVLMPFSEDFEERIIYVTGEYFAKPDDNEANNLISLLDLNNHKRVQDRKNYIKRRRETINNKKLIIERDILKYFQDKIDTEIDSIKYLRAIQEEFKINIWDLIPQP